MKYFKCLIFILLMVSCVLVTAMPAIIVSNSDLKATPAFTSKKLISLVKGEVVEIQKRERGWYQVKRNNKQLGWVTLLQVRFKSVEQTNSASTVSRIVTLRKGHNSVTATTGVRGIGEADIKNAKADFAALERAKRFVASNEEAKKFAKTIALKKQQIKYQEN